MRPPPSAPWECRGSAAVPTLQAEAFQFRDNVINDQSPILRQFETGDPPRVTGRQHLQGEGG
jgi:hypothetical protein